MKKKKPPQYRTLKEFIKDEISKSESKLKTSALGKYDSTSYYAGELVALGEVIKFLENKIK